MVLYSTKSGYPIITSQEPLLVLYSTISFRVYNFIEHLYFKTNAIKVLKKITRYLKVSFYNFILLVFIP